MLLLVVKQIIELHNLTLKPINSANLSDLQQYQEKVTVKRIEIRHKYTPTLSTIKWEIIT